MGSKLKATVALEKEIFEMVDQESRERHRTRSAIIEEALRFWQARKLEQALAEGYLAMAKEDQKTAEEHLPLSKEILS